jgi:hypothetical protein
LLPPPPPSNQSRVAKHQTLLLLQTRLACKDLKRVAFKDLKKNIARFAEMIIIIW